MPPKPEKVMNGQVIDTIYMSEQRYVKGQSVGDLSYSAPVKIYEIKGKEALIKDPSGEFWIPVNKLEIEKK